MALTLTGGAGYTIGTGVPVIGTITETVTTVSLGANPSVVTEEGAANLVYTFTRLGPTTNPLTVHFGVGGTSLFNTDYSQSGAESFSSTAGTVIIPAGSTTTNVTLDPSVDNADEGSETVALTLSGGTGYVVGTSNPVTGTITDPQSIMGGQGGAGPAIGGGLMQQLQVIEAVRASSPLLISKAALWRSIRRRCRKKEQRILSTLLLGRNR